MIKKLGIMLVGFTLVAGLHGSSGCSNTEIDSSPNDNVPQDTSDNSSGTTGTGGTTSGTTSGTGSSGSGSTSTGGGTTSAGAGTTSTGGGTTSGTSSGSGTSGGGTGGATIPTDPITYNLHLPNSIGWSAATLQIGSSLRNAFVYRPSTAANLPVIFFFHGTGGSPQSVFDEVANQDVVAQTIRDTEPAIIILPASREIFTGDWDHDEGHVYWDTTNDSIDTNPDLLFVRALIKDAITVWGANPRRVYMSGHSNGGFFAELAAVQLRQRVAAFAENAAGWTTCPKLPKPTLTSNGTSCDAFRTSGARAQFTNPPCYGGGAQPFAAYPTDVVLPGYLRHASNDDVVPPFWSCQLEEEMRRLGVPVQIAIHNTPLSDGGGHSVSLTFMDQAWRFLRAYSR